MGFTQPSADNTAAAYAAESNTDALIDSAAGSMPTSHRPTPVSTGGYADLPPLVDRPKRRGGLVQAAFVLLGWISAVYLAVSAPLTSSCPFCFPF